jgi:hypothetical protein
MTQVLSLNDSASDPSVEKTWSMGYFQKCACGLVLILTERSKLAKSLHFISNKHHVAIWLRDLHKIFPNSGSKIGLWSVFVLFVNFLAMALHQCTYKKV